MEQLKRLLYEKCIDFTAEGDLIRIDNLPITITDCAGGWFSIDGCGYSNCWTYSAHYIANAIEKKFVEEMQLLKSGARHCDVTGCPFHSWKPCESASGCAGYDLGV